jgi:hypothetical protein
MAEELKDFQPILRKKPPESLLRRIGGSVGLVLFAAAFGGVAGVWIYLSPYFTGNGARYVSNEDVTSTWFSRISESRKAVVTEEIGAVCWRRPPDDNVG